jgi:hypothetical protein
MLSSSVFACTEPRSVYTVYPVYPACPEPRRESRGELRGEPRSANQNLRLRVPRPIVAPSLPPPSRLSDHFITSLLPYILQDRHSDEKTPRRNSFSSFRLQMLPPATPFLSHPYKCPGGMGVNTSIPKVLLELHNKAVYSFCFHTHPNSFVYAKKSTHFFSIDSALFAKNTRGGGGGPSS